MHRSRGSRNFFELTLMRSVKSMNLAPIEPGNRVQLPDDWIRDLGLHGVVALERTNEGILIRPGPKTTWDEIFANKLTVGSSPVDANSSEAEVTGDDFLF